MITLDDKFTNKFMIQAIKLRTPEVRKDLQVKYDYSDFNFGDMLEIAEGKDFH